CERGELRRPGPDCLRRQRLRPHPHDQGRPAPHARPGERRVINMSSVGGFAPQPFMASYVASKHAVEGYSESVDHEVREHGVRILLVEPFNTSTAFDASVVRGDNPLPVYDRERHTFEDILADGM